MFETLKLITFRPFLAKVSGIVVIEISGKFREYFEPVRSKIYQVL